MGMAATDYDYRKLHSAVNEKEKYDEVHALRFKLSLGWIAALAENARRILELGGPSAFTGMVEKRWPGRLVTHYGVDLRDGFSVDEPVDLILLMEVLEHIGEREGNYEVRTECHNSGVLKLLFDCHEALVPGGHLFITTPNPCSITAIHHAMMLEPPMIFRLHVREFSPYELDDIVRCTGFKILRRETLDVWRNAIGPMSHASIRAFLRSARYSDDLRGEDTFALCQRPNKA
jgi:hypothetical protein